MKTLYEASRQAVDPANFALVIYDDQTDTLAVPLLLEQGRRAKPFFVKRSHLRGLISDTLAQRVPILMPEILHLDPPAQFDPIRPAHPVRSWLSIPIHNPLRARENACGALVVWSDQPNAFSHNQLNHLARLSLPAALAIRNIQLRQTEQRQALELAVINDIVQTLASTLHLDEVLHRIMDLVEGMLRVETGALLLTDPATQELVFQIALGAAGREPVKPFRLSLHESLAGYVAFNDKKPQLITRVDSAKRPYLKLADYLEVEPRNCLYVPLILKEQVIGVLSVMNKSEGTFTQDDANLLASIATYAAIAIHNARLHENMLAERDRTLAVEEETRRELANTLHDGPTQLVSGLKMRLDHCLQALQKEPALLEAEFKAMDKMCDDALHQMRTLLIQMLPPDLAESGQGLGAAVRGFIKRRQEEVRTTRLETKIISHRPDKQISRQDSQVERAIFNIIQETVNNALKHAEATSILVQLEETPAMLRVLIADDGTGFDVALMMQNYDSERGSLGMLNIRERAETIGGELEINSAPTKGTRIILAVPKSKTERRRKRSATGLLTLPPRLAEK